MNLYADMIYSISAEWSFIMRSIPKFLILTAALSCLAILPGKESSAQETLLTPASISENTTSVENTDDTYSAFKPALRQSSFNEDACFAKYDKDILQKDTRTLKVLDVEDGCDISFKSSDTDVLTVRQTSDNTCTYTGVGYGTAKITVRITKTTAFIFKEKRTLHAKVSVTPRAVSVMFRQNTRRVAVNKKRKLPLTIRPSISEEVPEFDTLNKKIATISSKGVVTGKSIGKTYVTATISNGQTAKCKINVVETTNKDDDADD